MKKFSLSETYKPIADISLHGIKIDLYRIRVQDLIAFEKLHEVTDYYERIRKFMPSISGLNKLEGDFLNNNRELLSADFIDSLSNDDLDKIADTYVSTTIIQNAFEQNSEDAKLLERVEAESPSKYLDRLLDGHIKHFSRNSSLSKINNIPSSNLFPFKDIFNATRKSSESLGMMLGNYEELKKKTEGLLKSGQISKSTDGLQKMNQSVNAYNEKLRKQRKEEVEMVALTAEMSAQSAKLLKDLSEAATTFLQKSEERKIEANRQTKVQVWFAVGSLIISTLLAAFALYYTHLSYFQDKQNNLTNEKWQNDLMKLQKKDTDRNTLLEQELITTEIELIKLKKDLAKFQNNRK